MSLIRGLVNESSVRSSIQQAAAYLHPTYRAANTNTILRPLFSTAPAHTSLTAFIIIIIAKISVLI